MRYNKLGSSDLAVSEVCLGSMTWGVQNNQQDADAQIEYALGRGVNFIDTAEMYAIPPTADTYGKTEAIIGNWLSRNSNKRKDIVLATKIAGVGLPWIRGGGPITGASVKQAVDDSLKRLHTDYIDVYQLHWPNRTTPHFAKHWLGAVRFSDADSQASKEGMHEILQSLDDCIKAGKIRHCGLSDDTPWGISQYMELSRQFSLPKMVSIQNEFNLLHLKDWPFVIEHCIMENIAYLPWSPLATGFLSGKYLGGARPAGSRLTVGARLGFFRDTPAVEAAVSAYKALAEKHGMSAATLALAWCKQVDGVTSSIIGATSVNQLEENINAFDVELSDEIIEAVLAIIKTYPAPF